MASYRGEKINGEIQRELSIVLRDIKDPRVPPLASVIKVEVTKDLKIAKAYISVIGDNEKKQNALKGLKSSAGFIRREIGSRLDLRAVPEFHFVMDDSIEKGTQILGLINQINKDK